MFKFDREVYEKRMEWFKEARFGMFLHWGLYAIPARGEWVKGEEQISTEEYQKYYDTFDGSKCQPKEWVKIAKKAGIKYIVFTAKHHDGFCLYDSKYTDYKATNTPCGRDFVREYVDACREEGIKVGLYYSLIDWHHEDFPHYGDKFHPMRNNEACTNENRNFDNYLEYMHKQVEELCTDYGKLDLIWFDFSYDDMRGEKWRASDLMTMVRRLQPDVIIDNRLEVSGEGFGSLAEGKPTIYHGDYVSPEKMIPLECIKDVHGDDMYWESCVPMNINWGYHATDRLYKSSAMLIKTLVECVSKGGNMLLNIGPDPKGNLPKEVESILLDFGKWMDLNGDSIYGCGKNDVAINEYGRITRKGNKIYYHLFENTIGPMPLLGIKKEEVAYMRYVATGAEVPISTSWVHSDYPEIVFADLGSNGSLMDEIDTVIEVTLKENK